MICRRPPSLASTRRQKPPAHIGCSASHLRRVSFSLQEGRTGISFAPFRLKTKKAFHIPFCKPELTRAPNLLINSIKWPPPHSSLCCVILNNVTFLCCFKWSIVRFFFGKRVNGVLCYTGPLWFVFSHNQATGGSFESVSETVKVLIKSWCMLMLSRAGDFVPTLRVQQEDLDKRVHQVANNTSDCYMTANLTG